MGQSVLHVMQALLLAVALVIGHGGLAPLFAQTFQGHVIGPGEEPVPTALVRLEDAGGDQVAFALADSGGSYVLRAPEPGEYVMVAERLGYEPFRSHPLAVENPDGVYSVDILMRAAPLPLEGVTVRADRLDRIDRGLRLEIGLSPKSLRVAPFFRPTIEEHLAKGHNLTDMIRWSNVPSIVIDGCFRYRNRHCIPVYLNGQRMAAAWTDHLPLELAETVVVVMPGETMAFVGGAVLLYTSGWIAPAR